MMQLAQGDRKKIRDVIVSAYVTSDRLANFLFSELEKNLEVEAGTGPLDVVAFRLVQQAISRGYIEDLILAIARDTEDREDIQKLCTRILPQLLPKKLVTLEAKITKQQWSSLFDYLSNNDTLELKRAFENAYSVAIGVDYCEARPDMPFPKEINKIKDLIERLSVGKKGPTLAVRFAEFTIEELQQSMKRKPIQRDLTPLTDWRNEIAANFDVPYWSPEAVETIACKCKGHLLVSVKELGDRLIGHPELYFVEGEESKPISSFKEAPTDPCSLKDILSHISEWIQAAEEKIFSEKKNDFGQIIIELFLPISYFSQDVSSWILKNEDEDDVFLGVYRPFVMRSLYRTQDPKIKDKIKQKLLSLVNGSKEFYVRYLEKAPIERGVLAAKLNKDEIIGLQLIFRDLIDEANQDSLFKEIRKSPALIALWGFESSAGDKEALQIKFNGLVEDDSISDFSRLAEKWRDLRIEAPALVKNMRLLCECPDRWPKKLPDRNNEAHKLIAS